MTLLTWLQIALVPCIALAFTRGVRRYAPRYGIVDVPTGESKKIHTRPIPLAGGVAVIFAFLSGVLLVFPDITHGYVMPKHLVGIALASVVLSIGGVWDDRKRLPPAPQLIAPVLAVLIIIASGIGITTLSNPFGEAFSLEGVRIVLFHLHGVPYAITLFADVFTFVWLMGMMYTTKLLDGLDGLVSSMAIVGGIFLAMLSFTERVGQPETGVLALICVGAFAGFILFNWHPASIFLGESGSLFAGFILGVLSIFSGAKIATTLLIFALPILDVIWVVSRRVFVEKRSPFSGDRLHIHQRLLDSGFSQRQTVMILLSLTIVFGACGLLFETQQKVLALGVAVLCMMVLGYLLSRRSRRV